MDAQSPCWMVRKGLTPCCLPAEEADLLCDLPDVRQSTPHGCGEAAVRCILAKYKIVAAVRLSHATDGVDPLSIDRCLRRDLHLKVHSGTMRLDDLKHLCNTGRPVICLVHWPGSSESHYVCVRGVSRGQVYFQDVESGPGKVGITEWNLAWAANDGRMGEQFKNWGICAWPDQP